MWRMWNECERKKNRLDDWASAIRRYWQMSGYNFWFIYNCLYISIIEFTSGSCSLLSYCHSCINCNRTWLVNPAKWKYIACKYQGSPISKEFHAIVPQAVKSIPLKKKKHLLCFQFKYVYIVHFREEKKCWSSTCVWKKRASNTVIANNRYWIG